TPSTRGAIRRAALRSLSVAEGPVGQPRGCRWASSPERFAVGARLRDQSARSIELESALCQAVEATPEDPIDDHDEDCHDQDAEVNRRLVTFLGHLSDVGPEAVGNELVISPRGNLCDDAGVPCAARRSQRSSDPERKYRGDD